jgi:hypothetical protein
MELDTTTVTLKLSDGLSLDIAAFVFEYSDHEWNTIVEEETGECSMEAPAALLESSLYKVVTEGEHWRHTQPIVDVINGMAAQTDVRDIRTAWDKPGLHLRFGLIVPVCVWLGLSDTIMGLCVTPILDSWACNGPVGFASMLKSGYATTPGTQRRRHGSRFNITPDVARHVEALGLETNANVFHESAGRRVF